MYVRIIYLCISWILKCLIVTDARCKHDILLHTFLILSNYCLFVLSTEVQSVFLLCMSLLCQSFALLSCLISTNYKQYFVCNAHIHSWSVFESDLSCQAPVVHLRCFRYWANSSKHFEVSHCFHLQG